MAVNLVNAVTINRIMLYRGQPSTTIGTVYTVPASTDAKIVSMIFCNVTSTAATITVSVVNTGGTAGITNRIISALTIPANGVDSFDSPIFMNTGDFIAALQGTASAITLSVSGETYA